MDALKLRGDVTTYNVGPGRPGAVPAQLRAGLRADGERLVQRHQDARRPPRPGPELGRDRAGHELPDVHGDRAAIAAWPRATSPPPRSRDATPAGPSSHISQRGCQGPNDTRCRVPDGDQGRRRPRLDRRAAGRRAVRRRPRRRPRPLRAAARGPAAPRTSSTTRKEKGYKYVATEAEMNGVTSLAPGERLLGLFHDAQHDDGVQPADRLRRGRRLGRRRSARRPTAAPSRR